MLSPSASYTRSKANKKQREMFSTIRSSQPEQVQVHLLCHHLQELVTVIIKQSLANVSFFISTFAKYVWIIIALIFFRKKKISICPYLCFPANTLRSFQDFSNAGVYELASNNYSSSLLFLSFKVFIFLFACQIFALGALVVIIWGKKSLM